MQIGYDLAALVGVFMALCAIVDYRTRKIPNWLTVTAAATALIYHTFALHGSGPLWSLAGFAIGFSLLIVPWLLGGGGMGDVKMLAALGSWLGPLGILIAFGLGTVLAAGLMMAVLTAKMFSDGFSATRTRYISAAGGAVAAAAARPARRVLPFAVPMAISAWLVLGWMLVG